MSDLFVSLAASFSVAAIVLSFRLLKSARGGDQIRKRLGSEAVSDQPKSHPSGDQRVLLAGVAERVAGSRFGGRIAAHVSIAHPTMRFSDFLALGAASAIAGALMGWIVFGSAAPALMLALGGPVIFDRVMLRFGGRRTARLEQQLPQAFALQSSALRAGHSTAGSLRIVAGDVESPLRDEIRRTLRELDLGRPLEDALGGLAARTSSRDVHLWVTAMLVQKKAGGNLAEVLEGLSERVRQRAQLRAEVRALTAQGRLSGLVVALAPAGFFLLLSATSRDQMKVLYSTSVGIVVLVIGLSLQVLGFLWIRRILKVRL